MPSHAASEWRGWDWNPSTDARAQVPDHSALLLSQVCVLMSNKVAKLAAVFRADCTKQFRMR